MKKLIRLLIKIPATAIIIPQLLLMIIVGYIWAFVEWLYEASEINKNITAEIIQDYKNRIKHWFTRI